MRLLILVLLVVLAVWMIRRALGHGAHKGGAKQDEVKQQKPIEGDLVACARCGVLLPRTEARSAEGALFCSDEHARLGEGGR